MQNNTFQSSLINSALDLLENDINPTEQHNQAASVASCIGWACAAVIDEE